MKRQDTDRFNGLLKYVTTPFWATFGLNPPAEYQIRWAFEDGRLNREEFQFMLGCLDADDPGIVGQWLPAMLEKPRFELQAATVNAQQTLF